ncbi:unnamed protein product [Caenorhabditis auriculariae]|uniref:Major facilitator superfamily (MFS) profile domain-containing protein n=1 Tax=Caenorhabditis auriculariae TaxID=2777116 RepID=A0A8S1HM37_9PELO|nr:unnamed protein product [Caenorhabditis auriculariae]
MQPDKKYSEVASINQVTFTKNVASEDSTSGVAATDWKAIVVAGVVTFIAAVENTVVGMSEWAYMNEIDKVADAQFFGAATAASKAGHAFFALVFAVWCFRLQCFRAPLIAGRLIAFAGCVLYLCVEFITDGRRYLMMVSYILFGIASSSSTILRAYVAAVSLERDRPQAYSTITSATMLSIIVGPIIQIAFTKIDYPGYEIFPNVRFHIYSAPIWVAAVTNFISIAIIYFMLDELPKRAKKLATSPSLMTLEGFKARMIATLSVVTLTTLTSIIFITDYGWTRQTSVMVVSICMGSVGALSIVVALLFFFCKLGKVVPQRYGFLFGMLVFVLMFVASYPYQSIGHPVAAYNETADIGCKSADYSWCETGYVPAAGVFLAVIIVVMGLGIPFALVSLDAIYSQILGTINQSVMQGAMIVAEDVVLILGPIYASTLFSAYGISSVWLINGVVMSLGALLWLVFLPRLRQYD